MHGAQKRHSQSGGGQPNLLTGPYSILVKKMWTGRLLRRDLAQLDKLPTQSILSSGMDSMKIPKSTAIMLESDLSRGLGMTTLPGLGLL